VPLTFHRDKKGVARAVWSGEDAAGNLLAQFFEAELGADATYRDSLCAEAEKHHHGRGTPWRTSGNLFAVVIEGSTVCLRPLFGANQNHAYTVDVSEFLALLSKWRELIG
jgi:hypothetical protein